MCTVTVWALEARSERVEANFRLPGERTLPTHNHASDVVIRLA